MLNSWIMPVGIYFTITRVPVRKRLRAAKQIIFQILLFRNYNELITVA